MPNPLAGQAASMRFLQSYWQRSPAVIRGTDITADPALAAALAPDALLRLAAREDVESRLVVRRGGRYRLEHGPLAAGTIPGPRARQWTVLVQGVDLHVDAAAALRARFRFVVDVRLDDVMVSLAADGGGVGPHVDAYDVFLVQISGRRRWRLAPPGPVTLEPDQPLRLLENFEPTVECELGPGDMLYLPPDWAHDGVGVGQCVTASVGFRAPSTRELRMSWLQDQVDGLMDAQEAGESDEPFRDALSVKEFTHWRDHPGSLSPGLLDQMIETLERWRPSREEMADFVGRMLTDPKPGTPFEPPSRRTLDRARQDWVTAGLRLDRRTRMAHHGSTLFINGDSFDADGDALALLARLADERTLSPAHTRKLLEDPDVEAILLDWAAQGWLCACAGL